MTKFLLNVVKGIGHYGNCFGVPNIGGELRFEHSYNQNILVNAFAVGLVRTDRIFYSKATKENLPVVYIGAKTGRDGVGGATMASMNLVQVQKTCDQPFKLGTLYKMFDGGMS